MNDLLLEQVRDRLARTGSPPSETAVARAFRDVGAVMGTESVLGLARRLRDDLVGTGPLEPLLADPRVSDVVVPISSPPAAFPRRCCRRCGR